MPRKEKKTKEEMKLEIWAHCLTAGFTADGMNCLYTKAPQTGDRIRLNFRSDSILKLEVKRSLPKEEQAKPPYKTSIWVLLEEAKYEKVEIGEAGELIFDKPKVKKTKKKKTEKRKESD